MLGNLPAAGLRRRRREGGGGPPALGPEGVGVGAPGAGVAVGGVGVVADVGVLGDDDGRVGRAEGRGKCGEPVDQLADGRVEPERLEQRGREEREGVERGGGGACAGKLGVQGILVDLSRMSGGQCAGGFIGPV